MTSRLHCIRTVGDALWRAARGHIWPATLHEDVLMMVTDMRCGGLHAPIQPSARRPSDSPALTPDTRS